ncbi:hypothetical protein FIBSPDRAFT_216617 [Athelia psychrophila]|uniref:AB hydrolase-1 domain-containing protein n=1 Tax=Athelia psychrophila TaxID=1759441 RepID=A0A165ZCT0_9AGAM|nr:hypothetical protein FIBSPDRAFT_216617 [Fibularhizoctonia sp. CBS 109695]
MLQAATDLAIAQQLGVMLHNGSISSKGHDFTKVVAVGHSYGSIQVEALTAIAPNLFDGVILTGFSVNATSLPLTLAGLAFTSATAVAPNRFSPAELSDGYISSANVRVSLIAIINALTSSLQPTSYQWAFLHYPGFTPATVARIQATEQPLTVGVMYTFTGLIQPAPNFTGPVHVVTGAKDFIFCLANCYAVPSGSNHTSVLDFVQELYPKVTPDKFSTYIPASTGHLLNGQESAPQTYANILAVVESMLAA